MKKVALVDLARAYGGAEKVVENLYKFSNKDKYKIYVICLDDTDFSNEIKKKIGTKDILFLPNNKKCFFKIIKSIIAFIKQNNIELLHAHNIASEIICIFIKLFIKIDVITTIHSFIDFDFKKGLKLNIYKYLENKLLRYNKFYIAVSDELSNKFNKSKVRVVYNGVKDIKNNYISSKKEFDICSIGRIVENKNQLELLKAIKKLKSSGIKIKCAIVGTGPEEEILKRYCRKEKIDEQVAFLGFSENIAEVFSKSRFYIINSKMEGLSISTVEAMSFGIPIIAYRVGGLKNFLNKHNCVEIKENYYESIADTIDMALKNESLLDSKVLQARSDFEQYFSIDKFIKEHEQVYHSLFKEEEMKNE